MPCAMVSRFILHLCYSQCDMNQGTGVSAKQELLNELRIQRDEPAAGGGRNLYILALVLAISVAALLWWWLRPMPVNVRVVPVVAAAAPDHSTLLADAVLDATGYITARRQATVSSEITARVLEVLVEEGQQVAKGELLARLDDELLQASLALASAREEEARSALREVEVNLVEAEASLRRINVLAARQLASSQSLDEASARAGSLRARLTSLQRSLVVAERAVGLERQRLDDTLIRAPFAGVVIDKAAQPGEIISPVSAGGGFTRTGICTIVDMNSLEIEVDVSESYLNRVQSGQAVQAVLNSYPDWLIPAQVITLIPAADRNRATVKVRIRLLEQDPRILPDMGVKVSFLAPTVGQEPDPVRDSAAVSARLEIPRQALWTQDGRQYVFVWNGDGVEQRSVSLGPQRGGRQWISAGLREGEQVVDGLNADLVVMLQAGVKVVVSAGQ